MLHPSSLDGQGEGVGGNASSLSRQSNDTYVLSSILPASLFHCILSNLINKILAARNIILKEFYKIIHSVKYNFITLIVLKKTKLSNLYFKSMEREYYRTQTF